jgi:YVTN family beta-propeller protein
MKVYCLLGILLGSLHMAYAGELSRVAIGQKSSPEQAEVRMQLVHRMQHYEANTTHAHDVYDASVYSPKSVNILDKKLKFYVQSLEGESTSVYSLKSYQLLKVIRHRFTAKNQYLFRDQNYFDYLFRTASQQVNVFDGKPVESCFSHEGKYLWVTYYRRSYDINAIDPSALCIIDTDADTIVRVMPTAPLPKMITCSPDNKTIVVSHWGDNTVGLIDISSSQPLKFHYTAQIAVDKRIENPLDTSVKIDRDNNCGNCIRGTVFTPDNRYVFVGKMGSNSCSVIDVFNKKNIGSIKGMRSNMRHLLIHDSFIYLSINKSGYVQKANWRELIQHHLKHGSKKAFKKWQEVFVGPGARTICVSPNGRYVFAAVNQSSQIAVVNTFSMKVVATCLADSYPVGMDISADGRLLIVTAQGKSNGGGNSVMLYQLSYQ